MKAAEPRFPKRAMDKARKIEDDSRLFKAAEDALQKAIDDKDEKAEKFCRQVFGAFAHILNTRGTGDDGDTWNTATMYSIPGGGGLNPRYDPDPVQEEYMRKTRSKVTRKLTQSAKPDASALGTDDDIPF
jgi:hypothetical protein